MIFLVKYNDMSDIKLDVVRITIRNHALKRIKSIKGEV